MSKFMLKLENTLKAREYSETTIKNYMSRLRLLNLGKPFSSFAFLKKIPAIDAIIEKGAENTQKNYYVTITSCLRDYKEKGTYRKTYDYYMRKLDTVAASLNTKLESNEKTETQEKNWMEWNEVLKVKKDLQEEVDKIDLSTEVSKKDFNKILSNLILALYTEIEPRRNKDYMLMKVTNADFAAQLPAEYNYYDTINQRFIFNNYKTSKIYEQQIKELKDKKDLLKAMEQYLKVHRIDKTVVEGNYMFSLLVDYKGNVFDKDYNITRNLNNTFDKNIGASMLRHIYNSRDKETVQKIRDLKETAKNMGHSVGMALNYAKID
jgi:hypothetical protein